MIVVASCATIEATGNAANGDAATAMTGPASSGLALISNHGTVATRHFSRSKESSFSEEKEAKRLLFLLLCSEVWPA
jgi:hypothetical protein